jgi:hypothetical protein
MLAIQYNVPQNWWIIGSRQWLEDGDGGSHYWQVALNCGGALKMTVPPNTCHITVEDLGPNFNTP